MRILHEWHPTVRCNCSENKRLFAEGSGLGSWMPERGVINRAPQITQIIQIKKFVQPVARLLKKCTIDTRDCLVDLLPAFHPEHDGIREIVLHHPFQRFSAVLDVY